MGIITSFADIILRKPKATVGKELFLNTDEGKVRVLTYNMENKDKLPLFEISTVVGLSLEAPNWTTHS